jgi:circadian clock protein KaiB
MLGLEESPHFLIPNYTATVDRWFDPYQASVRIIAELYPAVRRYQPLLDVLFELEGISWKLAPWQEERCNPLILETYRSRFPQLWENHELIARINRPHASAYSPESEEMSLNFTQVDAPQGYVLRLFVSGNNTLTRDILQMLHQFLERELCHPYTLKVIDISKHPELAESNQVTATPTLVRVFPRPVRRIVGSLDDLPRVLQLIAAR